MLANYLKIAFRNLAKNRLHSFINIAGLSVGMAVAMLIGLWIWDELSFDKSNSNYDRIAQVEQNVTNNGEVQTWVAVPYPLADELRKNYGNDFKYVALSTSAENHILSLDEKIITSNGIYIEPTGPSLLDLKMLKGDKNGLNDPSSILFSASAAKAFFGKTDPINKVIKIDSKLPVRVTGIYEDFPSNSSFADISFMAPWKLFFDNSWAKNAWDPWRPNAFILYTQLTDHADMATVSLKIRDAKLNKVSKELSKHKPELFLHPMSKWHLYSDFYNGVNVGGQIRYVWMFGIIGVIVLLLACINFMNLSTARSEKRAKEVGMRKTIGALRIQLIYQFFSESLMVSVLAFGIALLLVRLGLPFFNQLADKKMTILWGDALFWIFGTGFSLVTGFLAGFYPALYLSSFQPIKVLKGTLRMGRFTAVPRKTLVVIQFSASIILIIGTLFVFRQIRFAKDRPIGYSREGLVAFPMMTNNIHTHFEAVRAELTNTGAVQQLAESEGPTTGVWNSTSGLEWKGKDPNQAVDFPVVNASFDYGKTVGWQFKEGRDFSRQLLTDSVSLVLNESAAKFMGLRHPIGEIVNWNGTPYTVIGVINDMVMQSPYEPVRPMIYGIADESGSFVIARINPTISASEALGKIERVFRKYNPEQPFDYQFVDDEYNKKFGEEEKIGKLAGFFAFLAIFISCLGLFGMASFMAEQRVKEIGIRKVLGASVFHLWRMLSTDFLMLVVISLFVAIPAAYYIMYHWLQNYNYHTQMTWWIFAAAGMGAIIITLLTVSFQAISAAGANPVKSLRSE